MSSSPVAEGSPKSASAVTASSITAEVVSHSPPRVAIAHGEAPGASTATTPATPAPRGTDVGPATPRPAARWCSPLPGLTPSIDVSRVRSAAEDSALMTPTSPSEDPSPQRRFERACRRGHADEVAEWLRSRPSAIDPAAKDSECLRSAADNGRIDVLCALLEDGRADPAAGDNHAVRVAALQNDTAMLEALLKSGRVDATARHNAALVRACANGKTATARALLAIASVVECERSKGSDYANTYAVAAMTATASRSTVTPAKDAAAAVTPASASPASAPVPAPPTLSSPAAQAVTVRMADWHALHAALEAANSGPLEAALVADLACLFPASVAFPLTDGRLPLHKAALYAPDNVKGWRAIEALTRAYPEAVVVRAGPLRRTPVHTVAGRGARCSAKLLETMQAVVSPDLWRAALQTRDKAGRLPFGVAAATRGSDPIVHFFLRAGQCPAAAADTTPARAHSYADDDDNEDDDEDGDEDEAHVSRRGFNAAAHGRTPLHDAVRCGASRDTLVALLAACPQAALKSDAHSRLPAHGVPPDATCTRTEGNASTGTKPIPCLCPWMAFLHPVAQPTGLHSLFSPSGRQTAAILHPTFQVPLHLQAVKAAAVAAAQQFSAGDAYDTTAIPWFSSLCAVNARHTDDIAAAVLAAVESVSHVRELAEQEDVNHRRAIDVASGSLRSLIESRLLLFGRFAIDPEDSADKLHESRTCVVWRALDYRSGTATGSESGAASQAQAQAQAGSSQANSSQRRRRRARHGAARDAQLVVLKFMRDKELFHRELATREQLQARLTLAAASEATMAAAAAPAAAHTGAAAGAQAALAAQGEAVAAGAIEVAVSGAGAGSGSGDDAADSERPPVTSESGSHVPVATVADFVLPVLCHYDLEAHPALAANAAQHRFPSDLRYVLVLPAAQRTLRDAMLHESLASSSKIDIVRAIAKQLALALDCLHSAGFVHGDVKPLNIVRVEDGSWRLIDLDASALIGSAPSEKASSGYLPPELAESRLGALSPYAPSPLRAANASAASAAGAFSPGPPDLPVTVTRAESAFPAPTTSDASDLTASPVPAAAIGGAGAMAASPVDPPVVSEPIDSGTLPSQPAASTADAAGVAAAESSSSLAGALPVATPVRHGLLLPSGSSGASGPATVGPEQEAWALGVTLYQLCTGQPPWNIGDGGSASESALAEIIGWTHHTCAAKLSRVNNPLARNLIAHLLHPNPSMRPSLRNVAHHPFITGATTFARLPGQTPEYDVFISYRIASHKPFATRLHALLAAHGLRLWWDERRLEDGEDFIDAFSEGLVRSRTVVCLLSPAAVDRTQKLTADAPRDHMYLEQRLALELHKPQLGMLEAVLPAMMPDPAASADGGGAIMMSGKWFPDAKSFPDMKGGVASVEKELAAQMLRLGLGFPLKYGMSPCEAMAELTRDKGMQVGQTDPACTAPLTMEEAVKQVADFVISKLAALDAKPSQSRASTARSASRGVTESARSRQAAGLAPFATSPQPVVASSLARGHGAHSLFESAVDENEDEDAGTKAACAAGGAAVAARGGSPPRLGAVGHHHHHHHHHHDAAADAHADDSARDGKAAGLSIAAPDQPEEGQVGRKLTY